MEIKGSVENIVYRNSENGYTILSLLVGFSPVTVAGKFPIVGKGEVLTLQGEYKINKRYGEQFEATSVKVEKPTDLSSIEKYLSCGLIPGVGEVTARKIVSKFKDDTLKVIDEEPYRLAEVSGISGRKASEIHASYADIKKMQEAVMFLQKYDISINMAVKIYNKYKAKTESILMANPYKLIEDIDGIGFKTADKIAMKLGIEFNSEIRIKAGIIFVLTEIAEKQGSTLAFVEEILRETVSVLELGEENEGLISDALVDLEISGFIRKVKFNDEDAYAITKYYSMESFIARKLTTLNLNDSLVKFGSNEEIEQYEVLNKIELHENQKKAILAGTNENVCIITGGPGTGKTTIVKCILKILKGHKQKCLLMAPTGRAAKRMEEQTGEEASTIHRALEANFADGGRGFAKNEHNPLEADAIIIDEVSMLDVFLMSSLLKAVNHGTRIILVGDKDQLPSVGAGNVLADIIESNEFKVVELTQIYRTSEDSMIAQNAQKINQSQMPDLSAHSSDFFYSKTSEPELIAKEVVSLVAERIPNHFEKFSPDDIQVITPMKAGIAGANNLNVLIQEKLNPETPLTKQIELQKRIFRVGDRVMQIVNNYDHEWEKINDNGSVSYGSGVFNGDMGKIEDIFVEINEMVVVFDDGRRAFYSYAELDEIVLSYAITIHKSQGSEFPVVIIPVMGGSPLLMNKNLLYTAVTRAKNMVILIGKQSNIFYMVSNKSSAVRYTLLKDMLKQDSLINF
ncbi:MAG: ATP-dependent RecD-like DNA helicase [Clostridia bacterium]|nr:ATP-dependent RecD-like DNA helicase [Clostridia bacterium]